MTSLPVPVSPRMSTGASVRATRPTRSITCCKPESAPTTVSVSSFRPRRFSSDSLVGLGRGPHGGHLAQPQVVLQGRREGLQQGFARAAVARMRRRRAVGRSTPARRTASRAGPAEWPARRRDARRDESGQRPQSERPFPRRATSPSCTRRHFLQLALGALGSGFGQQIIGKRRTPTATVSKHDRSRSIRRTKSCPMGACLGEHPRDRAGRFMDLDVSAGFAPESTMTWPSTLSGGIAANARPLHHLSRRCPSYITAPCHENHVDQARRNHN